MDVSGDDDDVDDLNNDEEAVARVGADYEVWRMTTVNTEGGKLWKSHKSQSHRTQPSSLNWITILVQHSFNTFLEFNSDYWFHEENCDDDYRRLTVLIVCW